ncbi:MAG TPA: hypothetical protein VF790_03915 [Dissulfurispiraceae bacterium]
MFAAKNINSYCDFLFNELTDVKQKLDNAVEKIGDLSADDRRIVSEQHIISDLQNLSNEVSSELETIGKSCPRFEPGRSEHVRTEGTPYSKTPM